MPGQVLAVALGLVDLVRELGPARPHRDVRAAVGEDLAERRAPAARADDGDARARGIRSTAQGDPSPSGRDRPGSSARREPARRAAATSSSAMSAMRRSVAVTSAAGWAWFAAELRDVDGVADDDLHAAAQRPELELAVAREDGLRAPVRHRDERDVAGQREPDGTGLAAHRPQVGVARERALGVDDDSAAVLDERLGRLERLPSGCRGRRARDRNHAGDPQDPAEHRHAEEALLRHEARRAARPSTPRGRRRADRTRSSGSARARTRPRAAASRRPRSRA